MTVGAADAVEVTVGGAAAGWDDIDADASSIDPNETAEPVFAALTLLRGILTPSFIGIP